jgi:hypothetical protein
VVDANIARHDLVVGSGRNGLLLRCQQGCGRLLLVDRSTSGLTILDRGDPLALHTSPNGGIELRVESPQP